LNLYLYKSAELISRKKSPPGSEAAVSRAIQGNRSYHGLSDQFNVSNGSISNIMKLFKALSGELQRFATKKLQFATPKQDKLLVWLSKWPLIQTRSSSKRICRRKTWFQPVLPPPKEVLRDADQYASNPAPKYLIQEKNWMGRFEFPQKYRPMDIQGLRAKVFQSDESL
jgi:hypothetical protein